MLTRPLSLPPFLPFSLPSFLPLSSSPSFSLPIPPSPSLSLPLPPSPSLSLPPSMVLLFIPQHSKETEQRTVSSQLMECGVLLHYYGITIGQLKDNINF